MANLKDSGDRTLYSTGAVRDMKEGKGRCDLMPLGVVAELMDDDVINDISNFKESRNTCCLFEAIKKFMRDCCRKTQVDEWGMLLQVAIHYEDGARKYGPDNWQKGIPVHSYIDSALRHYFKYKGGWTDEPHDRAFIWNLLCCIWTMANRKELDDFTVRDSSDKIICGDDVLRSDI